MDHKIFLIILFCFSVCISCGKGNSTRSHLALGQPTVTQKKVPELYSLAASYNGEAFAALRVDGSVVTWGGTDYEQKSSSVQSLITGNPKVIKLVKTLTDFAALREDGYVVTWGYTQLADDVSAIVSQKLNGSGKVKDLYSNDRIFIAVREDGSVFIWGSGVDHTGENQQLKDNLDGGAPVEKILTHSSGFWALRSDGSVTRWPEVYNPIDTYLDGSVKIKDIKEVNGVFIFIREDNSIVSLGEGGTWYQDEDRKHRGIGIYKFYVDRNGSSVVGVRQDGSVFTMGQLIMEEEVKEELNGKVPVKYLQNWCGIYVAKRDDGSVVYWPRKTTGYKTEEIDQKLAQIADTNNPVKKFISGNCMMVRQDGSFMSLNNKELEEAIRTYNPTFKIDDVYGNYIFGEDSSFISCTYSYNGENRTYECSLAGSGIKFDKMYYAQSNTYVLSKDKFLYSLDVANKQVKRLYEDRGPVVDLITGSYSMFVVFENGSVLRSGIEDPRLGSYKVVEEKLNGSVPLSIKVEEVEVDEWE